jgi:hypothetical protein
MPTTRSNNNNFLSQYYTEEEVAEFLGKTINSLRADASRRKGAPRTVIGKRVLYNKNSFEAWILEKEVLKKKIKMLDKENVRIYCSLTFYQANLYSN